MRRTWKYFLSMVMFTIGLQLNFAGKVFVIEVVEPLRTILFLALLGVAGYGIWSRNDEWKDIGTMSIILIAANRIATKLPITAIFSILPSILLKIVSVVLIIAAAVLFTTVVLAFRKRVRIE